MPDDFPELHSLPLHELSALLGDAGARREWLESYESVSVFRAAAASAQEEAAAAAQSNLDAVGEVERLARELRGLQAQGAAKAEELRRLLARRQAALDRYAPSRLARDLASTADELDAQSEALSAAFTDPDAPPLSAGGGGSSFGDSVSVYGGAGGGGGGWDDGRSVYNTSGGGGGSVVGGANPAVTAAVREFREEYLALRKRYHMAHAKRDMLSAGAPLQQLHRPAGATDGVR